MSIYILLYFKDKQVLEFDAVFKSKAINGNYLTVEALKRILRYDLGLPIDDQ